MAQTLDQIVAGLNASGYDAQRAAVQSQINALPGQEAAAEAGLNTAKDQAFGQITNSANAKGMLYSGAPINEQNTYVGAKYLPALAQLKTTYADNTSKLEAELGALNSSEYKDANTTLAAEQKAEADAAAKAQQMSLEEARLGIEAARASRASAPSAAEQKQAVQTQFGQDLTNAFQGFGARPTYYTEHVIIPQLTQAYPELNASDISKQVYAYRKALGFG